MSDNSERTEPTVWAERDKCIRTLSDAPHRSSISAESTPDARIFPASSGQRRLWIIAQMFPDEPTYHEAIKVSIAEHVDVAALERGLSEITRRHEAWRTVFPSIDGQPMQQVMEPTPFPLTFVDLTNLPTEDREAEAVRLSVNEARRPLDLQRGPLVRAFLIRLAETESWLIVTTHHIVSDGITYFQIFVPELYALYTEFSRGGLSPLTDPPVQYVEFTEWQLGHATEDLLAPKLAYWRAQLTDFTELVLPTDYPRPSQMSGDGARVPLVLAPEAVAGLRELAHSAGVSLYTALLSAWKVLLFRYSGQTDIVVGSFASARLRPEFSGVMGFLVDNLILRTKLDPSLPFVYLLAQVGEILKAAREHQDVPLDRLVTELEINPSADKNPVFNHAFTLVRIPPLNSPSTWNAELLDIGTAKFDLTLELYQGASGLAGYIEYKLDLYTASTIERMAHHFQTLLSGILGNPHQSLQELPLLTSSEERQLAAWQGPVVPALSDDETLSLEQLFEAQAGRSPEAVAVARGEQRLTYSELNARANQLAHYLRARGVGPDTMVGLCMERSFDAMVGILGILKAGGAYVPLDPAYPRERLGFMTQDTGVEILVTLRNHAGTIKHPSDRTILLDDDWTFITRQSAEDPPPIATTGHLAYVVYTSGSTGRPKGVLVERRGLHYLAKAQEQMFGLGVGGRVLSFFSLNFDGSIWELTMAWPVGATLIIAVPDATLPGPGLVRLLKDEDINVVMMTPSALAVTPYADLPALHTLITAGEALPSQLVKQWAPGRQFFNVYGPTETTVVSVIAKCRPEDEKPSIGRPLDFVEVRILDESMRPVPIGVPGELYIGGPGVARGYLNRPDLTASRFVADPRSARVPTRLYKTGDRVRWREDGSIDYLGRDDRQVKLRGFRIELGEIEAVLQQHSNVRQSRVEVHDFGADKRLVAYVVLDASQPLKRAPDSGSSPRADDTRRLLTQIEAFVSTKLPQYMTPAVFVPLEKLPLLPTGKLDANALDKTLALTGVVPASAPPSTLESDIIAIWREILGVDDIGSDSIFFEIGGHSLALARVQAELAAQFDVDIDIVTLMRLPTVRHLARHIAGLAGPKSTIGSIGCGDRGGTRHASPNASHPTAASPVSDSTAGSSPSRAEGIAIVGMAIRAPGVRNPEELWEVVRTGSVTIDTLDPDILIEAGADTARVRSPRFIAAEGVLADADSFDASFFGYTDADAALMDPQQRLFLECTHEALEHAGYDPSRFIGRIGVFGGTGAPLYWLGPVADFLRGAEDDHESYRAQTLNSPDFLTTRVAFKLGLRGPAVTVQTACSTSLSAVHVACQSLLAGACDMAVAGGVSLASLTAAERGYMYSEGGIQSADGHCRPFDANASGTVRSSGVAVVILKKLSSALSAGDTVHAVVIGSAMNNDGAAKVSFTAPSEEGLANAIESAYREAGIDPSSVQFVEAHGTGTLLGDPIEVRALTRAYRRWTDQNGFCALGSLKANLGHLDAAAGAAGLIKTALTLGHKTIPKMTNFQTPNPLLGLPNTPFFISETTSAWPRVGSPRRAAVTAMGIGGTNVHVVLEEALPSEPRPSARPFQLVCLSAHTKKALSELAGRLNTCLMRDFSHDIADVAYTLAVGRKQHRHRASLVCSTQHSELGISASSVTSTVSTPRQVVFLFPGHGGQYWRMGRELYETELGFRREIDSSFAILRHDVGLDLQSLLMGDMPDGDERLDQMQWAQPFIFTVEHALARRLIAWGLRPVAMLGHSLGEYVAAAIAGVLSLRDALRLVAGRGRLMDATPHGRMLTVFADQRMIHAELEEGVVVATDAPGCVVLSGPEDAIISTRTRLESLGIETRSVRISCAAHSPLMRAIRDDFRRQVAEVKFQTPKIPIVSNVTGTYVTADQARNPEYWIEHLCGAVRLTDGLGKLLDLETPIFLEVGPGNTLGSFLKAHPRFVDGASDVLGTLPGFHRREESACSTLLRGVGRAWQLGADVDWEEFYAGEARGRIPLPTYPFDRRAYALRCTPIEDVTSLDNKARDVARELSVRGVDDYPGLRPRLETFCASLVFEFFSRRLGAKMHSPHSLESLCRNAGIAPTRRPMLEELTRILIRTGLASHAGSDELILRAEEAVPAAELSERLREDYPNFSGLVHFITHCVAHYDEALTGVAEPVGVLYPDGTDAWIRDCLGETPHYLYAGVYLRLAEEAVLEAVNRRRNRKTRILEVGGGHGKLTWPLVTRLRCANVEYHFTDVGRSFLHRAEGDTRRPNWMTTFRFDLNRSPEEQDILRQYDMIVGYNAVHVACDLSVSLQNLHSLLAPGGSLILVELTRVETWDHLTWGLAPGYWEATVARGALGLDLARWESLFRETGFTRVIVVPSAGKMRELEDHGLLIAEKAYTKEPTQRRHGVALEKLTSIRAKPDLADTRGSSATTNALDDTEQLVQGLWKRLLGVSHVPPDANFFDLGGDSLLAVQLMTAVRAKTGRELTKRQFAAQPTVEGLVTLLRSEAAPTPGGGDRHAHETDPLCAQTDHNSALAASHVAGSCLVPLRARGTKRPFFCVHPIGGGTLAYAPLATALDPERPFFGIESPMVEDPAVRPHNIEKMAEHYVEAVRQVQERGPYLIGGWSFGGVVAIEMARQLMCSGERVAQLVLFDVKASAKSVAPDSTQMSNVAASAQEIRIYDHHRSLWQDHEINELAVAATHFVATGSSHGSQESGSMLPIHNMEAVYVPGDHFTLLSGKYAPALARKVATTLDVAEHAEHEIGLSQGKTSTEEDDVASVRAFLGQFVDRMSDLDAATLTGRLWMQRADCVFIPVDDVVIGSAAISDHYARSYAAIRNSRLQLYDERILILAPGKAACATAKLDAELTSTENGSRFYKGVRVSWVLEKKGHEWRVVHAHYSLPVITPRE